MKKLLISLVMAAFFLGIPAMGQTDYKQIYERKIKSYSKMRNTGATLATIGGIFTIAGTALVATIPDLNYDDNGFSTNDDEVALQATGGILCLAAGIDMLIAGIVVGSIGGHKCRDYKRKLNNVSMGVICTPKQQGLMLTLRF
jgi:hypothetical protein